MESEIDHTRHHDTCHPTLVWWGSKTLKNGFIYRINVKVLTSQEERLTLLSADQSSCAARHVWSGLQESALSEKRLARLEETEVKL